MNNIKVFSDYLCSSNHVIQFNTLNYASNALKILYLYNSHCFYFIKHLQDREINVLTIS